MSPLFCQINLTFFEQSSKKRRINLTKKGKDPSTAYIKFVRKVALFEALTYLSGLLK
jgi:hypothetical protein